MAPLKAGQLAKRAFEVLMISLAEMAQKYGFSDSGRLSRVIFPIRRRAACGAETAWPQLNGSKALQQAPQPDFARPRHRLSNTVGHR